MSLHVALHSQFLITCTMMKSLMLLAFDCNCRSLFNAMFVSIPNIFVNHVNLKTCHTICIMSIFYICWVDIVSRM